MPKKMQGTFLLILALSLPMSLWASKRILVDLTHQIAIAYEDGKVKFYGRISSGRPGMETPTGTFHIREKALKHVSNLWPKPNGGATMPYMMRITHDGVAMHLDPAPDYPASHGCIRLRNGFAQRMYAWAPKWTRVDVIGKAPAHSPAVALPAYARSKRILMRSMNGGNGNPLAILSGNPKINGSQSTRSLSHKAQKSRSHTHANPLSVLSGHHSRNTRHHASKVLHRHRTKHRRKRNRHPNPLKSVSGF